ncbi:sugar kinase [Halomonas lysinitropha]|uniref:2-dehydro-3-deoxygluconokinase n=1 Tax=Halomonas lysinitropha TaxID=2607506 RepID=A0A5K1I9N1_9GAMM|nr:sugar kinase [Halomonas lysinitropha]VVZ97043.1 2-dehydro-3-deoxygluconokinase [Halomonas lysinitropha]
MFDIATSGELLAEFMAEASGQRFDRPGRFTGPFPSGAPAIFASQAARLGARVAYAGRVGRDGFGDLVVERLRDDGIDVEAVQRDPEYPTGTAFVSYQADGSRRFIFNLAHSASGRQTLDEGELEHLSACRYFHVMGSSLASRGGIEILLRLVARVKARGGRISFDPNVRLELVSSPEVREALLRVLAHCDLFLPSDADLEWLAEPGEDADATVARLRSEHPLSLVVLKQGAAGCRAYTGDGVIEAPGLAVAEVDPTGAGDCFGGALVAALVAGRPLAEALRLANAAGAHAVTVLGPMEGCSDQATLERRLLAAGETP